MLMKRGRKKKIKIDPAVLRALSKQPTLYIPLEVEPFAPVSLFSLKDKILLFFFRCYKNYKVICSVLEKHSAYLHFVFFLCTAGLTSSFFSGIPEEYLVETNCGFPLEGEGFSPLPTPPPPPKYYIFSRSQTQTLISASSSLLPLMLAVQKSDYSSSEMLQYRQP